MCHREKPKKGKKVSGAEARFGLLIQNPKGNLMYRIINQGYLVFMIVKDFSTRILWVGSCCGMMFMMPLAFELFNEQQKVMMKI